jgi:hypothetical protein
MEETQCSFERLYQIEGSYDFPGERFIVMQAIEVLGLHAMGRGKWLKEEERESL